MTKLLTATLMRGRDKRPLISSSAWAAACKSVLSAMTIGRHGWSIRRPVRRPCSMKSAPKPRSCPNALSSRYVPLTVPRWRLAMTYDPNGQLWNRRMGIRFSPPPKPTASYPQLDLSRFIHDSSHKAHAEVSSSEPQAELERGDRLNDEPVDIFSSPAATGASQARPVEVLSKDDPVPGRSAEKKSSLIGSDNVVPKAIPPISPLPYQIIPEQFHRARGKPAGSPGSYWTHTMYQRPRKDGSHEKVKVHYCTSKHTMEYVCRKYFEGETVLGFDLEWNARATKQMDARENVSLIQMASPGHIGLFHCAVFSKDDFVAPTFKTIMEDPKVSKAGVNIRADCTRVRNYLGVDARGIFELSNMYKMVKYIRERRPGLVDKVAVSLATQVQEFLGLPLRKALSVRLSEWSRLLNEQQILYSASDAYAGIQLFYVLDEARRTLDPCPPRPHHVELNLPLPIPKMSTVEEGERTDNTSGNTSAEGASHQSTTGVGKLADTGSKFRDSRVAAADVKMQQHRSSHPEATKTRPCMLRAYYLWYCNEDLKPADLAKFLREPPLQSTTVVWYILEAVTQLDLPYCRNRMKNELLSTLDPSTIKLNKYQPLAKSCQPASQT